MIEGYEDYTAELTVIEKKVLVPRLVAGLKRRGGKKAAITARQICEEWNGQVHTYTDGPKELAYTVNLSQANVRKLIHHVRVCGLVPGLVASSVGYYVTKDPQELAAFIATLESRRNSINQVVAAMRKQHTEMLQ